MRLAAMTVAGALLVCVAAPGSETEISAVRAALEQLEAGRPERALEILEAAAGEEGPRRFAVFSLLGRTQLRLGRAEDAVRSFDQALARAPGFLPARVGRAEAELALGRHETATAALERLAGLAQPPPRALELLAGLRFFDGDVEVARSLWHRLAEGDGSPADRRAAKLLLLAISDAPGSRNRLVLEADRDLSVAAAYLALGVERLVAGDRAAAARRLRIAHEIDEHDTVIRLLLERATGRPATAPAAVERLRWRVAEIYAAWEAGRSAVAARDAREILEARPRHAPLELIVARVAELDGDHWTALEGYESLASRVGTLPSLAAGAARAALAVGALGIAECRAREALAATWDDADAPSLEDSGAPRAEDSGLLRLLAAALAGSGARAEAIETLRRATRMAPDEAANWLRLGDLLFEATRATEALAAYRRAVGLDAGAAEEIPAFALAAVVSEAGGELDLEAVSAGRSPESADTLYSIGIARLGEGDLAGAERSFSELARVAPDDPRAAYNLGQIYRRQGRVDEARRLMDRFAELEAARNASWQLHNRAHFRRLEAADKEAEGLEREALALYEANAAEGTANVEDHLAAARLLLALERPADAHAWLERVFEAVPYDRRALELLAEVQTALGQTGDAERTRARLALLDRPCAP